MVCIVVIFPSSELLLRTSTPYSCSFRKLGCSPVDPEATMATHLHEGSHSKKDDRGFSSAHDEITQQDTGNQEDGTSIVLEKKEFSSAESRYYDKPRSIDEEGSETYNTPAETAKDLVTEVLHAEDDPTLNPWTFRVWFLGKHFFNGLFRLE
jgi:hypothetical protein